MRDSENSDSIIYIMKDSENSDSQEMIGFFPENSDSQEKIGYWKKLTIFISLKMSDFWTAILYIIAP